MPYPQELEELITEMVTAGVSDEDIQSVADQFLAEHGPTPPGAATQDMLPPSRVGRDPGMPIVPGIVGQAFQGAGERVGEMVQGVGQIPGMISKFGENIADFAKGQGMSLAATPQTRETLSKFPGAALEGMGSVISGVTEPVSDLFSGDPKRMGSGAVDAAMMAPLLRLMGRGAASGARATGRAASRASQKSPTIAGITGDEGSVLARLRRTWESSKLGDPEGWLEEPPRVPGTQTRRDYVLHGRSGAPGAPVRASMEADAVSSPRAQGLPQEPPGSPDTISQVARLGDVKAMAARLRELELKPIRSMLEEQEYQALYRMVNKGAQTGGLTSAATGKWE